MALFVAGKSQCGLCGQLIERREDVVGMPPFLGAGHRLSRYSDAVFHKACFDQSPDRADVERLHDRFKEVMRAAPADMDEYERWAEQAMKEFV